MLELREKLLNLSKTSLLEIFKNLNGGSVGFDHERTKRVDCVERLLSMYDSFKIEQALAHVEFDMPDVTDVQPKVVKQSVDSGDAAALSALRSLLGGAVDENKVREIVAAEVKAAIDKSPITTIVVQRPDGTTHKAEGHVRAEFEEVLVSAGCGLNILLVGPAGCGKTHLAIQVAEALGREFASISCTAGMSESALTGWMLPADGGAFEYTPSDFVTMYENGGVFLFDEMDAADPNTLLFVNQALANGSFYLPQRKGRTKVKRHVDFVCLGAANTFGTGANMTYAGRERLDEATLDRFRAGTVLLDYDTRFEKSVIHTEILAWGWAVRKKIIASRLSRVMSTRFLLDATKLMAAGRTLEQIKSTYFIGWKADEKMKVEA